MFPKGKITRQMSITESFGKAKAPGIRFSKPVLTSDVVFEIEDTDSEVESVSSQNEGNILITPKIERGVETSVPIITNVVAIRDAGSNCSDSPNSVGSGSSGQTMIYEYLDCVMDDLSSTKNPRSPSNCQSSNHLIIINDPNNFNGLLTSPNDLQLSASSPESKRTTLGNASVKRKLSYDNNNEAKKTIACEASKKKAESSNKNDNSAVDLVGQQKTKTHRKKTDKSSDKSVTANKENSGEKESPEVQPSHQRTSDANKPTYQLHEVTATTQVSPRIIQHVILTPNKITNPSTTEAVTIKKPFITVMPSTLKKRDSNEKDVKSPQTSRQKLNEASKSLQSSPVTKKSSPLSTPKKMQADIQTPSTSKSPARSPLKSPRGSPRKSRSPLKGSPRKNQELKNLKAKEGKQLQIRQLRELGKLFQVVASGIHLKSLLTCEEYAVLKRFVMMEDDQKYFVMKLFTWKKTWYNIFKFCSKAQIYTEDDKDVCDIFEYLREENFVDTDYKTSQKLSELLIQLDKKELKEIMDELRIVPSKGTKEQLISAIFAAIRKQTTLTKKTLEDRVRDEIEKKMGFAVKIRDEVCQALHHAYTLATFTNPAFEDIQAFFRQIIHFNVQFPETDLENFVVFDNRESFVHYAQALKIRRELEEILGNRAKPDKVADICTIGNDAYNNLAQIYGDNSGLHGIAPHLKRFTAEHVYSSVLTTCCDHVYTKTNGKPEEVKKWIECLMKRFPTSRNMGRWYYRLIWLHMKHLDNVDYERAAKYLIEALESKSDRFTERDKIKLDTLSRPLKSSRKHKVDQIYHDRIAQLAQKPIDITKFKHEAIDCLCIRSDVSGRKRTYIMKGNQEMTAMSVEEVALLHYSESGFPGGKHCEGSLVKALLILYFWDIIYKPERVVPGTFISKLQTAPLDIFSEYFYQNRQDAIERRLKEIEFQWSDEKLVEFGSNNWDKHSHEQSVFGAVQDTIADVDTVEVLVTVIGRKVMAKIFARLINDLRENSSGMPDLLVWNVDQKIHKFVEVKGEGDRLAPNQILWLDYLHNAGASVEVCLVHSLGSKRKKIKKFVADDEHEETII